MLPGGGKELTTGTVGVLYENGYQFRREGAPWRRAEPSNRQKEVIADYFRGEPRDVRNGRGGLRGAGRAGRHDDVLPRRGAPCARKGYCASTAPKTPGSGPVPVHPCGETTCTSAAWIAGAGPPPLRRGRGLLPIICAAGTASCWTKKDRAVRALRAMRSQARPAGEEITRATRNAEENGKCRTECRTSLSPTRAGWSPRGQSGRERGGLSVHRGGERLGQIHFVKVCWG
jgi:hypothetical protein